MKTLALNTFVGFENEITAINETEIQNLVSSIAEGLEDDLFIVLYTVCASHYIGFSVNMPKSGDLTQAEAMAQLASQNYADGAIVFHMIVSPRSLMHECRMMAEIDYNLASNSVTLLDYYTLKDGIFSSFQDSKI